MQESGFTPGEFIGDLPSDVEDVVDPSTETHEAQTPEQKPESDQDRNWKAAREKLESLEKEREQLRQQAEMERYKRELLEQQYSQYKPLTQVAQEEDPFADLSPDDWTTRSQVEKLAERKAMDAAKRYIDEEFKKRAEAEIPQRLQSRYPDFEQVVSKENVEYLRSTKPEIAAALSAIGDKYGKAVAAYEYIKMLMPQGMNLSQEKEIAEKNLKKPGNLSSVGSEALSQAKAMERGLTPDRKKALFKEMQSAIKGY